MALTRAQQMKQKKSSARIDKTGPQSKDDQKEQVKIVPVLPKIPAGQFRAPTYQYSAQAKSQNLHYDSEEQSDDLIGYLQSPLKLNIPSLESEEYPKIAFKDIPSYKGELKPILIIKNEIELESLILMLKLSRDQIFESASQIFKNNMNLWFLPDGKLIAAQKDQKSLKQVSQKALQQNFPKEQPKSHPRIPKWLILSLVIISAAIFCFAFASSSGHVYSSENKLINRQKLLQILELEGKQSNQEIKNRYKKLAQQYHPDRNSGCEDCAEKFDQITAAYKKLLPGDFEIPTSWSKGDDGVVKRK
ncbi:Chaperone protein DnaJ [Spironucleus salmonicida]|uniref:Chaperone protein DnaJ n=1 Tax=Spironucleus salmonicida TaxID=348837 RepID=V6LDH7_9EUKA|nr:Chaperone protein DnaJ [Spironucleus salmonicida]|eukprot:EST42537.1 Chaperone protein DnaJ [Spironucleus salmonicida]